MYYVLMLVGLVNGEVIASANGEFETWLGCFGAREEIVNELGDPPVNYQAVCVKIVPEEKQFN